MDYEKRCQYLEAELRKEQEESSRRFEQIQELKKEFKRMSDLYIDSIGKNVKK